MTSLLPGPVEISAEVRRAFALEPISHRQTSFLHTYQYVRARLSELAGGLKVAVVAGSGTTANDMVAANLRASFGASPGLVLANGEFGERLVRQARRAKLSFRVCSWKWGEPWDFDLILSEVRTCDPAWIWCVHLETSTGVLNNLEELDRICKESGAALVADCVSSLGATRTRFDTLFLASGVSGKSLGAYAGLAFVFASERALRKIDSDLLPSCFDVPEAARASSPQFTIPSPLVLALEKALARHYTNEASAQARFDHYQDLASWIRKMLRECSIEPLASECNAAPVITTFKFPGATLLLSAQKEGFRIASESGYLVEHGWAQIGNMGDLNREKIAPLFQLLRQNKGPLQEQQLQHATAAEAVVDLVR